MADPSHRMVDNFQNLRRYFDINRNTDNPQNKETKKDTNNETERNKQASNHTDTIFKKQTSKQTDKETQTLDICHLQYRLFFVWSDAMAAAIAWAYMNKQVSK